MRRSGNGLLNTEKTGRKFDSEGFYTKANSAARAGDGPCASIKN